MGIVVAALGGCRAAVESGLDEQQANRVVVALEEHGISARKVAEDALGDASRFRVEVASDAMGEALSVLQAAALPRRPEPGLERLFDRAHLVPSATEEQAKISAALAGELTRSLESLDDVLDARVHLSVPMRTGRPLDAPPPPTRASVLLKHAAGNSAPEVEAVQRLVSGAVPDMQPTDVAVVRVPGSTRPARRSSLVHVGPLAVTARSAGLLKLLLGGTLLLNVVLAGAVVALLRRARRTPAARSRASMEADVRT